MGQQSVYSDFMNYIKENQSIIDFLHKNKSLLDEYITPIIRSLTFLMGNITNEDGEVGKENLMIFESGFQYLVENIEELKLYVRQLNNDYLLLEKMSLYIKLVFDLDELRAEIVKFADILAEDKEKDLKRIDSALEFFEDNIVPNAIINDFEMDDYLKLYYEILDKYPDLVLMSDAFNEYCATYGI